MVDFAPRLVFDDEPDVRAQPASGQAQRAAAPGANMSGVETPGVETPGHSLGAAALRARTPTVPACARDATGGDKLAGNTGTAGTSGTAASAPDNVFTMTDSPCVAVCSTLFDDVCRGCGRTAGEVSNWVFLSPEEKQVVWARIRAQGYPRRKS